MHQPGRPQRAKEAPPQPKAGREGNFRPGKNDGPQERYVRPKTFWKVEDEGQRRPGHLLPSFLYYRVVKDFPKPREKTPKPTPSLVYHYRPPTATGASRHSSLVVRRSSQTRCSVLVARRSARGLVLV